MISVIICSRDKKMLSNLSKNIADTIGEPYEIVAIDNSQNEYNIFSAYNRGVELSHGDILCFCHEDILIHTDHWGTIIKKHFESDPNLGLIGVVGGKALPNAPFSWWTWGAGKENEPALGPIIQHYHQPGDIKRYGGKTSQQYYNPENKDITYIKAVDGLFFCIPRSLFTEGMIRFDDKTFSGFHFYDIDICRQIEQYRKLAVVLNITIEHFSNGNKNRQWHQEAIKCYHKWQKKLPTSIHPIPNPKSFDQKCITQFLTTGYQCGEYSKKELQQLVYEYTDTIKGEKLNKYVYRILYKIKYPPIPAWIFYKLSKIGIIFPTGIH